jgi:hypothetical protein
VPLERHARGKLRIAQKIMLIRPSPAVIAARKREIAQRYARKERQARQPFTLAAVRVAELTRLYESRWPARELPDDDDGETALRILVNHIGHLRDAPRRISRCIAYWAPWLGLASHERLITAAVEKPLRYRADKLAWKLKVTAAERDELGLRTIGAIDQTRQQRQAIAKVRRRERAKERRAEQGAMKRADYEANSVNRAKPWIAEGISRATWFRRRETGA